MFPIFSKSLTSTLPQYVDPVSSAVVYSLQRGLEEYACRPTGSSIELESRIGQLVPAPRLNASSLPIIFSSTAVLHPKNQQLFRFKSEMPPDFFFRLKAALREVNLLGARGQNSEGTFPYEMKSSSMIIGSTLGHRLTYGIHTTAQSQTTMPLRVGQLESVVLKSTTHTTDVCSPEWGWDFRLALAKERAMGWCNSPPSSSHPASHVPLSERSTNESADDEALDLSTVIPRNIQLQSRHSFMIHPFFRAELSHIQVAHNPTSLFARKALESESVVIPSFAFLPHATRVEAEVKLPQLYRAWKSFNRGRLHSSRRDKTTAVGGSRNDAKQNATRWFPRPAEDPFLRHVAFEWLTLLQFLCSVRLTK